MAGIHMLRVLAGGAAAGIVTVLLEWLASLLTLASLTTHRLALDTAPSGVAIPVAASLPGGWVMVCLRAASAWIQRGG